MINAGRSPPCSRPRAGSKSAHTTAPSTTSIMVGFQPVPQRCIPDIDLRQVLVTLALAEARHVFTQLPEPFCPLTISDHSLDRPGHGYPLLPGNQVDSIPKRCLHFDRRHGHKLSVPEVSRLVYLCFRAQHSCRIRSGGRGVTMVEHPVAPDKTRTMP